MKTKTLINPTRRRDFLAFFALLFLTFTVLPATAQMMYKQNDEFSFSRYYFGEEKTVLDNRAATWYAVEGTGYSDSNVGSVCAIQVNAQRPYHQIIYPKGSLTAGVIDRIGFYQVAPSQTSDHTRILTIWLLETSDNTLSSFVPVTTGNRVCDGISVKVEKNKTGWLDIPLETPFTYHGNNNLLVCIWDNTGQSDTDANCKFRAYTGGSSNVHRYYANVSTDPNGATAPSSGNNTAYRPYARFRITPTIEKPTFSPSAGMYNTPQEIEITCTEAEATIYYTTDGSDPKSSSTRIEYSDAITISNPTSFKAVAEKGGTYTDVASATYEFQPLSPSFLNTGIHSESATVTIEFADSYTEDIYYTTDGTTPSASNGTLYSDPFTVTTETTVKAVAVRAGWSDSQPSTGHYLILNPNGMTPSQNPAGLVLDKKYTPDGTDGNNSGLLTLESYVTGESVTISNVVAPTDIVLVLDYSASMNNTDIPYITSTGYDSKQKRIEALETAVNSFLAQISSTAYQPSGDFTGMKHRVAYVTYGDRGKLWYNQTSSPTSQYADCSDTIGHYGGYTSASTIISPSRYQQAFYEVENETYTYKLAWNSVMNQFGNENYTELEYAMPIIKGIFDNNSAEIGEGVYRNRMVVVFTDGGIGSGDWMGSIGNPNNISYAEGKANYTLRVANNLKNNYGVTFYSVGIFPDQPTGHTNGISPYYSLALPEYHYPYSGNTLVNHNEYSQEWADNVSRFMALRSSNYPNSTSMTNPGTGSNSNGYFIIATDAAQLTDAFTTISQTVATPSVSLGSQTVVEDVISDAFMLPEGTSASDIKVYTANCIGVSPYTFDTPVLWNGAQVSIDGKHILVTNFDFADNWCGENTSTHVAHGKKLILEIPIERDYATTSSGGTFNTNGEESGVYNESGSQVGAFQSPLVYLEGETCTDFDYIPAASVTAYDESGILPYGWNGFTYIESGTYGTYYAPHISSIEYDPAITAHDTTGYGFSKSLVLTALAGPSYYSIGVNHNSSYAVMPPIQLSADNRWMSFRYLTNTDLNHCTLELGYMTSVPTDGNYASWETAFHSFTTPPTFDVPESPTEVNIDLDGQVPSNSTVYLTFRWTTEYRDDLRTCYIDDVCFNEEGPVDKHLWTEAVTSLSDVPAGGFVVDGDGNVTINCKEGLAWLISYVNGFNGSDPHTLEGKTVTVTKPLIDMSEYIWVPIGYNTTHPFKGTFDGGSNVLCGVHVDQRKNEIDYVETKYGPMVYAGMFGYTDGATVKNTTLLLGDTHNNNDHITCRQTGGYLGALVAYGKGLDMELCYVFNGVVAYGRLKSVGGLVGHAEGSGHAIKACMSGAHLAAGELFSGSTNYVENLGGIVGSTGEGYAVTDCFSAFVDLFLKYFGHSMAEEELVENMGAVVGKGHATSNVYVHPFSFTEFTSVDGGTAPANSYWYALEGENYDNVTEFTEAVPRTYGSYPVNNTVNGRPLADVLNDHVTPGYKWMTPPTTDVNLGYPVIVKESDEGYSIFTLAILGEHFLFFVRTDLDILWPILSNLLSKSDNSFGEKASEMAMGTYMYSNGDIGLGVPAALNFYIDENVALTQSTTDDVNASVGITIKNPNGSGAEHRDWHTFATPLKQAPLGIKYCEADQSHTGYAPGSDNFLDFGTEDDVTYDYAIDENGYFPAGIANRTQFDFYSYYEPEYHWINLKRKPNNHWHEDEVEGAHPQINYDGETGQSYLEQGKGYLVGLGTTTENNNYMQARGVLTNGVVKHAVTAAGGNLKGYNLLGNPYQSYLDFHEFANVNEDVLWGEGNTTDTGYMAYLIFDAENNRFEQYLVDPSYVGFSEGAATTTSRYLNMHQGFFVVKRTEDPASPAAPDSVVFNSDMRVITANAATFRSEAQPAYPLVNLFCTDADGNQEIVIMELERPLKAGSTKMKGMLNGKCNMYAHWGNDDLGAVFIDYMPDYVPVWFEAAEDGVFTITWSTANENFGYMHLIDNIAGVDYDCLAPGNDHYTFTSSVNDMSARFRVVFKPLGIEENESEGNGNFAFFNGSELIVNGEGDMRLTDLNGRCVYTQHLAGQQNSVSLPVVADGMYLLQLKGAEGVKVQKIVIRK